jgi:small multidrug resistance pump
MADNRMYIGMILISAAISSVSQIILKKSAEQKYKNVLREYLNLRVFFAYSLFFFSTLLTTFSYRVVPLSMGAALEATGYFWVPLFGLLFLKEPIMRKKQVGLGVILFGILIFNL